MGSADNVRFAIRHTTGPEAKIQQAIINMLRIREWFVKPTHGNMYQSGFPDLYACHVRYGARWIEVKNKEAYEFTPAQVETFPQICAHGVGIWILTAAVEDEYLKLFRPFNWYVFLK